MNFTVETEQEDDGRWIAELLEIPGALVYGATRDEAIARVRALGLRVLANRIAFQNRAIMVYCSP